MLQSLLHPSQPLLAVHPDNSSLRASPPTAPLLRHSPLHLPDQHPQEQDQVSSGCPKTLPPTPTLHPQHQGLRGNHGGPWGCLGNFSSAVQPPASTQKTYVRCQSNTSQPEQKASSPEKQTTHLLLLGLQALVNPELSLLLVQM